MERKAKGVVLTKLFKCEHASGGVLQNGLHRRYDGGIWEMKETAKQISFTHVAGEKPNETKIKIKKADVKLHDFLICDGMYCFYPHAMGIPYYFTEIKQIRT